MLGISCLGKVIAILHRITEGKLQCKFWIYSAKLFHKSLNLLKLCAKLHKLVQQLYLGSAQEIDARIHTKLQVFVLAIHGCIEVQRRIFVSNLDENTTCKAKKGK